MAGNEWINGYLEAILDSGVGTIEEQYSSSPKEKEERGHYNPTKYFVDEVVNGVDETDLYKTWIKVVATRNTRERSSRLENMCWRIWHLARKNKQLEWEGQQRLTKRRTEREGATEDVSEDLSECEKGNSLGDLIPCETPRFSILQRTISSVDLWSDDKDMKRLYIVLISLHGLVRGENMELGRDSDTGGQVKYVVELARALAKMKGVYRVDLFTRQISSSEVDWSYGEPTEMLCTVSEDNERSDVGESSGAYIIRIPFGPRDKYLSKELLWPYIQEFVDGALSHIVNLSKVLGEQIGNGTPVWPYVIHGHYADAGESAALLSGALNVPMVLTGHSLGRNKLEHLLKQGRQSKEDINSTYKIMRRIEAEELSIDAAELVITSTEQEIDDQWGLYDGFDVKLERVLRARSKREVDSHGRFMPRMAVIPPGMDFSNVVIQEENTESDVDLSNEGSSPKDTPRPPVWSEIMRFLNNPHKPMILALSRPDPKKNLTTLIKAFGECRPLRELANLTLIMGNRDDIDDMSSGNANVLTSVLKLIDTYDLYGLVAYPKRHKQSDVPDIYRLAARTKGVFINPALVEPFGLTLIEAAAHGLPMVATRNGGPVDIHRALNNGLLVDPHDQQGIADALLKLVSERTLWHECQKNGWKNIHLYSWPEHCRAYLTRVGACRMRHAHWQTNMQGEEVLDDTSFNDSLKDDHDICLKLSIDGEKSSFDAKNEAGKEERTSEKVETNGEKGEANKCFSLRKKKQLIILAIDSYDEDGNPDENIVKYVRNVAKVSRSGLSMPGLALSTAMAFKETLDFMKSKEIEVNDFDVMICSSGSELYCRENDKFVKDEDYGPHIGYRWGFEGLKRTVSKLVGNYSNSSLQEDMNSSNSHCVSYLVKDSSKVMGAYELRRKLRMRGLRCHPIYCRRATRLQIVPLLCSRSMALRYLFLRWKINLQNMHVIVGETGDTDHDAMLVGIHNTIIVKGVSCGSKDLVRSMDIRDDIVPKDSPNVIKVEDTLEDHIASILK